MCGRYNLLPNAAAWLEMLGIVADLVRDYAPRYNIAPSQQAPVIRQGENGPELAMMRWGFVPHWMRDENPKAQPINARADTAASKPYFRDAIKHTRCLVPATGFYEWQATGNGKQPWHIHRKGGAPFLMAGIWSEWQTCPDGPVTTFAVLTTDPNELMKPIHNRMPVVLTEAGINEWLENGRKETLGPYAEPNLEADKIRLLVNNPKNDSPAVLKQGD